MSSPTFLLASSAALDLRLLSCLLRVPALASTPRRPARRCLAASCQYSSSASTAPSSVSPSEVSHFSRLASSWWDPHGPSRLLHLMNPLRHDFIQTCLSSSPTSPSSSSSSTLAKKRYLDIGCGGGIFSSSAARLPGTASVTAIDPTPSVIAVAKAHQRTDPALGEPKLQYLNCAIEDLPVPGPGEEGSATAGADAGASTAAADVVTLFEVLEHVPYPSTFLALAARHLRPGGWLVGSTIARSTASLVTTKLIAEAPVIGVVPRGTHDWDKYINPDELAAWFEQDADAGGGAKGASWGPMKAQGVIYLPGLGWKVVPGSEGLGNYFFGAQKLS